MQIELSIRHKTFADEYILTGNAKKAYAKAYPTATEGTCETKGSALAKKVHIQAYIREMRAKIDAKTKEKLIEELSNRELPNLLTAIEKREILAKIARGEIKIEEQILYYGTPIPVERLPSAVDRIKAIDTDNKMTGDIAPIKQENKLVTEDGKPIFIMDFTNAV